MGQAGGSRLRRALIGSAALLLSAATVVLVPVGAASAATILKTHPSEGTAGTIPTAAGEFYTSRTGQRVTYSATPAAAYGATALRFSGAAATYFDDTGLSSATQQLLWSAPILLPSLPPANTLDKFLAARRGTSQLAGLEIAPSGRLRVKNGGEVLKATSNTVLRTNTWYQIDALFGSGQVTVLISDFASGALLETIGPVTTTTGVPTILRTGLRAAAGPLLIDTVQVADDWLVAAPPPPPPPPPPVTFTEPPCGAMSSSFDPTAPPTYEHVVVLMEENVGYNTWQTTTNMPFFTQLAGLCGSFSNMHAATHPSQPNYMAATSGVATAVGVKTDNDNIFNQVQQAGGTWKAYEESIPAPCSGTQTATYKPGHNPAYFYNNLRTPTNTCLTNDVAMDPALATDIAADNLPTYSWITPNECHDFYWVSGCSTPQSAWMSQGDAWLSNLIPQLTAMPSYQAGQTLILITFDEGSAGGTAGVDCSDPAYYVNHEDCHIPTLALSSYIVPGTVDSSDQNLYSLLATTEDILGLARLGNAVGQPSMRPGLGF